VSQPDPRFTCGTRAPRRQERLELGNEFRLDEQLREGEVGLVRVLGSQHDLGIGRDVDLAVPAPYIGHRQLAKLGIGTGLAG
jgi:hypothetical protein